MGVVGEWRERLAAALWWLAFRLYLIYRGVGALRPPGVGRRAAQCVRADRGDLQAVAACFFAALGGLACQARSSGP
jgi:hypothetical protein